ncbi:GNAT family N-acetyltransferase [Haladaptatus sp. NG-SE-30]
MRFLQEDADDRAAVHDVHAAAFPTVDEAILVDSLRESDAFVSELSLVAKDGDRLVGHVLFTQVEIPGTERPTNHLVLAPVAVAPEEQRRGIGSELIETGLETAANLGYDSVILHGSTAFYPRFGFTQASEFGLDNPFDLPDEDFMALELHEQSLAGATGEVGYPDPFFDL